MIGAALPGQVSSLEVWLHAAGWAVVHGLWMGAVVVGAGAFALRAAEATLPRARYAALLAMLAVTAALPAAVASYLFSEYLRHIDWVLRQSAHIEEEARHPAAAEALVPHPDGEPPPSINEAHRDLYPSLIHGSTARHVGLLLAGVAILWLIAVREYATDALACSKLSSSKEDYVLALTRLEIPTPREQQLRLALDGGRSDLIERARRLLQPPTPGLPVLRIVILVTSLAVFAGLFAEEGVRRLVRGSIDIVMEHDLYNRGPTPQPRTKTPGPSAPA